MFPYLRLWKCIPFAVSELISGFRAAQREKILVARTICSFIIASGHYCDSCAAAVLQNQGVWEREMDHKTKLNAICMKVVRHTYRPHCSIADQEYFLKIVRHDRAYVSWFWTRFGELKRSAESE